jgi:hypothetical protein
LTEPATPPNPSPAPAPSPSPAPAPSPDASVRTPAAAERPDYLPETAWDSEAKAPRADFIKTAFDTHAAHEARLAARPEKPDGYKLELPKEFKSETPLKFLPDDPRVAALQAFGHKNNWSQAEFSEALTFEAMRVTADNKSWTDYQAAEKAKAGANGEARATAIKTFLTGHVGEETAKTIFSGLTSYAQFEAVERLMTAVATGGGSQYRNGGREQPVVVAPPARREDVLYPTLARKAS